MAEFETRLSKEIYEQNYKFGKDKDIHDSRHRTATALAKPEKEKQDYWAKQFKKALDGFAFCTAGRILSNAGTELGGTSMINCFVSGFEGKDRDSMSSIMDELRRQAFILKSEGGYGFNVDTLRPRGGYIGGIGGLSPGAVRMLDMWDTQSETITRGAGIKSDRDDVKDKIRKGAQMVTMSCWHPDVEEFITAKQEEGRLTKFNMSVLATDEFIEAVKNNEPWSLEFPDHEDDIDRYEEEWTGDLQEWKDKGYPVETYKTFDDANELWNKIMRSTYNRNEPGVLFVDRINDHNNLWYEEYISATNPCGEQLLPPGGVCLLGSLNLTQFLTDDWSDWDYEKLEEIIPIAVRMMDNVNDQTYVPLERQEWNLQNKRRIGLGIMGLGSALMMQKLPYGSKEGVKRTEEVIEFIANKAYQASAKLAEEKEPFPLYDEEKYMQSEFVQRLSDETKQMIRDHGIRNSHLLSIQPTGNTSTLANTVSGGLEPVFMHQYVRTAQWPYAPDYLPTPETINWKSKEYTMPEGQDADSTYSGWQWIKEGDTPMLKATVRDETWKIDQSRGLLKEELVEDYGVRHLKERGEWDPEAEWAQSTSDLSVQDHVNMMEALARYIDSAMSKTVNLPEDYPFEDFKDLYMQMYDTGVIKGGTTYRDGTMATVLSSGNEDDKVDGVKKNDATPRPDTLPCHIHKVRAEGGTWRVLIGLLEGDPYEVFAFKTHNEWVTETEGHLDKRGGGQYDLYDTEDELLFEDITGKFETDEQEALTRMISSSLRHGMDISFIVEQLNKSPGLVTSFNKAVSRVLSKYATNVRAEQESLEGCDRDPEDCYIVREEGCIKCLTCGESACT